MHSTKTFSRLTGVTIKAPRLYERLGLLVPTRTDAGHRRYATADIQRFERVLALKSLGLELRAVQTVMRGGDVSLGAHRERLEEERRKLDHAIDALEQIEEIRRLRRRLNGLLVRRHGLAGKRHVRSGLHHYLARPTELAPRGSLRFGSS